MAASITQLPPPQFVDDSDGLDPNLILADMVAEFEAAAGRTLYPAQVERLLINLYAYRESLVRNAIQYTGQQNLLAFAAFPMLDYLGQLLGVVRLPAQGATSNIQFTLAQALGISYAIPAGTLVGTSDGQFTFATANDLTIAAGTLSGTVAASAVTAGTGANGYLAGQITTLLDPNALIASASNTTVSGGGSAPETDDHLRARIQAAPNSFSVAGPEGAYRYFALSSDPTIVDAQVLSPAPGQVSVCILAGPITQQPAPSPNPQATAGTALMAKVIDALTAGNVRPLTDTVTVSAIYEVDYAIAGTITLFADAEPVSTMAAVNTAAADFAIALASRIQRDIVPSQIVEALSVPGVYQVTLVSPLYAQLQPGQWANCIEIVFAQAVAGINS